ncbi:amino acid aminotransferase [Oceanomicrobium pacificus]|uniref:Aminotransferase n=1 Tax=Oceanomicrobium pacificus TaxID=2692916 RepID=A0A6B0TKA8_9RHOB|nr:amino acid aminotransferase [Oceanomicrobium pacificus]MXU64897.1 aminotransferase class I/II-fold pyridoxal phosphate-dependent enzyme [Oceanomicrobium pacificus]
MLELLKPQPADKIIALMGLYAADPRDGKIDLGVGVYKDANGKTPIMRAVKAAEARLHEAQTSKSYVGLLGDLSFVDAMRNLVLGTSVAADRVTGAQTPGGTGAIRQLAELVKLANPQATVWLSDPTWPNHPAILKHLDIPTQSYRYFDAATCEVNFDAMMEDLEQAQAGDVVLLHGCCHNPTGANLDLLQWRAVTDLVLRKGLIPFVDLAYQGFGDGLEDDVQGMRHLLGAVPQAMVAASCSKNFGLYRDRVGVALVIAPDEKTRDLAKGALSSLNRLNYSFPPDHGAALVSILMNDADLRADWQAELEEMRTGMLDLRTGLAEELRRATNSDRFDFVANHRGMFSRLGLPPEAVEKLRDEHAIYMVGDSRINIAGLPKDGLTRLAQAVAAVLS